MNQLEIETLSKNSKTAQMSREQLIQRNSLLESELVRLLRELYDLRQLKVTEEQAFLLLQEQIEAQHA
jgi:hypothetical protein